MKRSLLAPLLATAAVYIASCDRTATVARPPTATPDTASETDDPTRLAAADQAAHPGQTAHPGTNRPMH